MPDANGAKTLRVDGERLSVADCVGCRTRVDDDVISAPRQRLRHQWRHQRVWCHQCQQLHCHRSRPPPLAACTMMTETAIIPCFYTLASIWRHHLVLHWYCMVLFSVGRPSDLTRKRQPGLPRAKWTDQLLRRDQQQRSHGDSLQTSCGSRSFDSDATVQAVNDDDLAFWRHWSTRKRRGRAGHLTILGDWRSNFSSPSSTYRAVWTNGGMARDARYSS